ncbi:MAG: ribonuclease P protein component [Myxococcota bacterium]
MVTSPRDPPAASHPSRPRGPFPKRERVRKRREYLEIQAQGKRVTLTHFVLIVRARAESDVARLGITASRKVGVAVVRSRIRRVVREAYRATRDLFPPDVDVVVIVKRAPKELGLAQVIAEFRNARGILLRRIDEARRELNTRRVEA